MSNTRKGNTNGKSLKKHNQPINKGVVKQPITVNANCKGMELFSLRQCDLVMGLDAPTLTSDSQKFKQHNRLSYYVLINTWLFQVEDVAGALYMDLQSYIMRHGLVSAIRECSQLSNEIVEAVGSIDYNHTIPEGLTADISPVMVGIISSCVDEQQILQLLRYPKRFCPSVTDKVTQVGIDSFIQINDWCKTTNALMEESSFLKDWAYALRPHIALICRRYHYDTRLASFSNGTASDAEMPLASKIQAYATKASSFDGDGKYPVIGNPTKLNKKDYTCQVLAVPKSYKTPRIIAMESAYRQYHMQAIRRALERSLGLSKFGKWLDPRDQDPNRVMCFEGSVYGSYATIDLSSASDSLSRSFVRECFPLEVWQDMETYLARYMEIPNERNARKVNMFSTSGSALTFPVESIVFFAICYECTERAQVWFEDRLLTPRAFGDDMVVDNRIFSMVLDVLTNLRFRVNREKSFGGECTYRESCGVEFVRGLRVETKYFPRANLDWFNGLSEALASLCSLQHKLFSNRRARLFLAEMVKTAEPRMTSHSVGTECADLWSLLPECKYVFPPTLRKRPRLSKWDSVRKDFGLSYVDEFADWSPVDLPSEHRRERHLTIKSKYPDKVDVNDSIMLRNLEMWRYRHFLQHGPTYEDGLSELLNVTQRSLPLAHMCNRPKVRWEYVN